MSKRTFSRVSTSFAKMRLAIGLIAGLGILAGAALVISNGSASAAAAPAATSANGPFVTLLFSRTEMTAADNTVVVGGVRTCTVANKSIARLDNVVAPYLSGLGLQVSGSIQTTPTQQSTEWCSHAGDSLSASWDDATKLSTNFGWKFLTHSATYPTSAQWAAMTSAQIYAETCGSAQIITSHGLSGVNGMFPWPNNMVITGTPLSDVESCFKTSRLYGTGVNTAAQVQTAPYEVLTRGLAGGFCALTTAPCHTPLPGVTTQYIQPSLIISRLNALTTQQWLSLQAYVLVFGKSPTYTTNGTSWDCTPTDPAKHWTNDAERYCYTDFQTVMNAIAAAQTAGSVIVTDTATAAAAFGR